MTTISPALPSGVVLGQPSATTPTQTPTTVTLDIDQAATRQFAQRNGAFVNRVNDRLLVGAATVNEGNMPRVVLDWLSTITGAEPTTELAQLASLSTIGG